MIQTVFAAAFTIFTPSRRHGDADDRPHRNDGAHHRPQTVGGYAPMRLCGTGCSSINIVPGVLVTLAAVHVIDFESLIMR